MKWLWTNKPKVHTIWPWYHFSFVLKCHARLSYRLHHYKTFMAKTSQLTQTKARTWTHTFANINSLFKTTSFEIGHKSFTSSALWRNPLTIAIFDNINSNGSIKQVIYSRAGMFDDTFLPWSTLLSWTHHNIWYHIYGLRHKHYLSTSVKHHCGR